MKYLIVEDERFAYEEVKRMITKLRPEYELEKQTKTVIDTIAFLKTSAVDFNTDGHTPCRWQLLRDIQSFGGHHASDLYNSL